MLLQTLLLLPALFLPTVSAIFADDAYHIDYHWALLGRPLRHTTFLQQPFLGSKASLVYTLSERNVLAAVNPKDGAVVWRQLLSTTSNSSSAYLTSGEGQDTVLSAIDGQVGAWNAADGRLVWENRIHASKVKDLEVLALGTEQDVAVKDALVLVEGETPKISRLDGASGRTKWQHEDTSGDAAFQLSTSATHVYYISHHGTFLGGYKTKVTSLNPTSGEKLDSYTLSSDSELSSPESILFVGANGAAPIIVWTDKSHKSLKINVIGSKGVASFNIDNKGTGDITSVAIHAPSKVASSPHFLVEYNSESGHWAEVFHVDVAKASVAKAFDIPFVSGQGVFTASSTDENVYFTRISAEEVALFSSSSNKILGKWERKVLAATTKGDAYPVHGVTEAAVRADTAQAVRSAVLFSNGDWSLIRNGETVWTRPEALSSVVAAAWAEASEEETLAHQLELEGDQNPVSAYVHRLTRHIADLQYLPGWLQALPDRLIAGFSGSSPVPDASTAGKDTFGFRKYVVAATSDNRLIGLDVGSAGKVLWNVDLGLIRPNHLLTKPILESLPNGNVQINDPTLDQSLIVSALTGEISQLENFQEDRSVAPGASGTIVEYNVRGNELVGYVNGHPSSVLWQFQPFEGESIVSISSRPANDPVASLGKVLGDRRVLYKYLNPNLVVVSAVAPTKNTASFYLLDSVSGNILYTATHTNVDTTARISSTISENWMAYSFTSGSSVTSSSRGSQLVVAEFFESSIPNDRGPLAASGNMSSIYPTAAVGDAAKPYVLAQTYHISEEISHMSVTHTKQGITSRQLLAVLPQSNAIVGIPRQIIDPRRPVGRAPKADEAAEGLTQYAPNLEFNPQWYLNHKREVFGIDHVITTPSSLESTSLVFAFGLDVFGTRVAPSFTFDILGKDFNKIQMLITVAALFVGVLFVAPLVTRKQINMHWQVS